MTEQKLASPTSETAKRRPAQPNAVRHRPIVTFRLPRPLLDIVDDVAARLSLTRSDLIATVLEEYLEERGEEGLKEFAKKRGKALRGKTVNLFA